MVANGHCFVEWKEQYVSKERGNRVVHYFLKDSKGESVLAVVGTERSVRHMLYVVSEEFLSFHDNSVHTGFRWRSRREVVNWLTSMLSKQHSQGDYAMSPKDGRPSEVHAQQFHISPHKGCLPGNLKGRRLDISWSGAPWACGKQLKHYPAFCRNGISIAVQSFVSVISEKKTIIAYLEDMYEDRKCQKKVKVRWFHYNEEARTIFSVHNPHPKEIFITPYTQVITADCVDGPAIILTYEHFEKFLAIFPNYLLDGVHFCFRQFKNNRIKPFKLSKLPGYFDQQIFSCFNPEFFEEEEFSSEDGIKAGDKRNRTPREDHKPTYEPSYKKCQPLRRKPDFHKHVESQLQHAPIFAINEKVECLCQDSGIRGCWFRCTVLEVSRRQMRVLYDDVKDEDNCSNLEEWIPTCRLAKVDKLRMRHAGRPTVRPAYSCYERSTAFDVGYPVDAWWSDGWWEGVISSTGGGKANDGIYQIYVPGENLHLNVEVNNLRTSREWIGDHWVDIQPNPNFMSLVAATSVDAKLSISSAVVEEELDGSAGMALMNVPLKDDFTNDVQLRIQEELEEREIDFQPNDEGKDSVDGEVSGANADGSGCNSLVECEIVELKCEAELMELQAIVPRC